MKTFQITSLILLSAGMIGAQSLLIYTGEQTPLQFELSAIDSITISATPLSKAGAASSWQGITVEPLTAELIPVSDLLTATTDGLQICGNDAWLSKALFCTALAPDVGAEKTILLKWKVTDPTGEGVTVTIDLHTDLKASSKVYPIAAFTTGWTPNGGNTVVNDKWYLSRIRISGQTAESTTYLLNPDGTPGPLLQVSAVSLPEDITTFALGLQAPRSVHLTIGDLSIEKLYHHRR